MHSCSFGAPTMCQALQGIKTKDLQKRPRERVLRLTLFRRRQECKAPPQLVLPTRGINTHPGARESPGGPLTGRECPTPPLRLGVATWLFGQWDPDRNGSPPKSQDLAHVPAQAPVLFCSMMGWGRALVIDGGTHMGDMAPICSLGLSVQTKSGPPQVESGA